MFGPVYRWVVLVAGKGVIVSVVMFTLDVTFWKQLIIATVSSTITGLVLLVLGRAVAAALHALKDEIEHVKRGLGLDKRHGDNEPNGTG